MTQLITANQFRLVPEVSQLAKGFQQGQSMRGQFDQRQRQKRVDTQEQSFLRADVINKGLGILAETPEAERPAMFESMKGQLAEAGIDASVFTDLDFSDAGIASSQKSIQPLLARSKIDSGLTTAQKDFKSLTKAANLDAAELEKAARISLGLDARASLSSAERIAMDEEKARLVAEQKRREAKAAAKGKAQGAAIGDAEVVDTVAETETTKDLAKEAAKHKAAAIDQLPTVKNSTRQLKGMVNKLKNHKGFAGVVGAPNAASLMGIPGTPEADFKVLMDQIKGGTFLKGFQSLKGGGTITEVEGAKAENALARLSVSQSEEQFIASLDDYIFELGELEKLVEMKAKGKSAPEAAQGGAALNIKDLVNKYAD